jgi:hypothetical protein
VASMPFSSGSLTTFGSCCSLQTTVALTHLFLQKYRYRQTCPGFYLVHSILHVQPSSE